MTLTAQGANYTSGPTVTFSGGGGSGAAATASIRLAAYTVTNGGSGYSTAPRVIISPPPRGGVQATATAAVAGGQVVSVTAVNQGSGYTTAPTITFTGGGGTGAAAAARGPVTGLILTSSGYGYTLTPTATISGSGGSGATATVNGLSSTVSLLVQNKSIIELFEPTYGRMNATLGVELPFTSALTQTAIPLGYIDPATETMADGEIQIWKITHNGVDSHPVHFHLVNVQLINRVGWDGTVKPPHPNEEGWKETVKMNPLEDIIVAVRSVAPKFPFGLPESTRLLAPALPLGSTMGFTQIDPTTGNPAVVSNVMANFGWEYVWHCHILGHEENDFMRPFVFRFTSILPNAPSALNWSHPLVGMPSPCLDRPDAV